jgi:hypothetical protein
MKWRRSYAWECSKCGREHINEDNAMKCEATDSTKRDEIAFPKSHPNDTRYKLHCVKCGDQLYEFERILDSNRSGRGRVIKDKDREDIFGGTHCKPCASRLKRLLTELLQEHRER